MVVRPIYETGNYYASLASYRKAVEEAAANATQANGDQDAAEPAGLATPSNVASIGDFNQLRSDSRAYLLQVQSDKNNAVGSTPAKDSTGGQKTSTDFMV